VRRSGLRTSFTEQVGGLPAAFWWLWFGTLINRAGTFVAPFFVLYLTGPRGVSVGTAGTVLTVLGIGSVISQPLGGVLTDRFGRRATLGIGQTSCAIVLFSLSFARPLWLIALIAFVLGVVADLYRPAVSAAVADLVDAVHRPRAFALQFWAINLGFSVASLAAGVLLHFGFGTLFVLDAITTLAFGMLALRFIPETKPESDGPHARLLDPLKLLRTDRLLLVATLLMLVYAVLYIQASVGLPLAIRGAELRPSIYGYVIAINGVVIVFGQPLSLPLMARWSRRVTLSSGIALVGIGFALTGLCHSPWQFAVSVAIWSVGEVATAGSFQALVTALAPDDMRGRYAGAVGLAWGTSGMIGPLLGASAFSVSPALLWVGCAVLGLVAAIGQYWLVSRLDEREAHRSEISRRTSDVEAERA
jgi:MFS family permease